MLATLTRETQGRMHEMIPPHVLTSADGSNALLERLDAQAGSRAIDEERRAMRLAMYDVSRKGAESLMQYADRRETQFASAAALGHQLPDTYMAQMMIERANLTAQNEQNLRTMTGLRPSMAQVLAALKVLDTQSGEQLFDEVVGDEQKLRGDGRAAWRTTTTRAPPRRARGHRR